MKMNIRERKERKIRKINSNNTMLKSTINILEEKKINLVGRWNNQQIMIRKMMKKYLLIYAHFFQILSKELFWKFFRRQILIKNKLTIDYYCHLLMMKKKISGWKIWKRWKRMIKKWNKIKVLHLLLHRMLTFLWMKFLILF